MKKIAFWIWTALCIAGAITIITLSNRDVIKTGEDIVLTISDTSVLVINKEATLEAASPDFFVLRKLTGEVINGIPTEIPLGWKSEAYYKTEPMTVQGEWLVEKGSNITIQISAEESMSVRVALKENSKVWGAFLMSFLAFLIWLLVLLLTV